MDSDEALFDALVAGDMRAFDRLYDRFSRPLFAFIRGQLRDPSEAEDVLHEAFMAVLRARGQRHEIRSFRAWLYKVAHHLCMNRARKLDRGERAVAVASAVDAAERATLEPERAFEAAQLGARLKEAVMKLPAPLAEIYRLRTAGLSYDEVAVTLDVPLGTVKSRMHDMVQRLRKELER